ncbi:MAG: amino acid racemase [Flavobacteriales bacterium]|nr:amino acid racemase [Flavobacteriales bacterium]MCC6939731.1 amino acid racemase [Flavobacteriales bacterium]
MRTLGLIGGTSWHSTVQYYQYINQAVNDYFGNNTNPPLLVYTLNQNAIHRFQVEGKWDAVAELITEAAFSLKRAGAEALMFCANTPHKVHGLVEERIELPIIHISDVTAKAIQDEGVDKVCFIGTKFSMEEDFILGRMRKGGVEVLVPGDQTVRDELHRIIQEELTFGRIEQGSKRYVLDALRSMIDQGAEGVVLGCTEFPLMITRDDLSVPVFDTTRIHSNAAVEYILNLKDPT